MSLARPWWLVALASLLPLLLLHLRRPALTIREVPSLLVWDRLAGSAPSDTRRLRRPRHPLLLALQTIVVVAFVFALAGPRLDRTPGATTVYVLDDSFWMSSGSRFDDARAAVVREAAGGSSRVAVVSVSGTPRIVYRGGRSGVARGIRRLRASNANADLGAAITLAAGQLGDARGHVIVLRAPEDAMPPVSATRGQLSVRVVGEQTDDQGIFGPQARCGVGPDEDCEVLATVRNGSGRARIDSYTVSGTGQRAVRFRARVAAHSSTSITLTARPGSTLHLRLAGHDANALDDDAVLTVPGTDNAPAAATVTLVGDPTGALPLAQAFASVPGVTLLLRTPATYRAGDARASELVVLDGSIPTRGLPQAPAILLVAPTRLPGGSVDGPLDDARVSSTDTRSALLEGVDLTSLDIARSAARTLAPAAWMRPIVSSPDGPLFSAGDDGHQRVAVLAFDPRRSNLAQLPALPILARNLVGWAESWVSLGDDGSLSIDALPGARAATIVAANGVVQTRALANGLVGVTDLPLGRSTVSARPRGVRSLLASRTLSATARPISLASWSQVGAPDERRALAPWLIGLALLALTTEWGVWRRIR